MAHDVYKDMRIKRDEFYTTKNEAHKLVRYIEENNLVSKTEIIWLPFDNEFSNIYKALSSSGFNTVMTNLENGQDFYQCQPQEWNIIITNPPFSGRTYLMGRLMSFNKPFIILQATQYFNNQFAVNYLCEFSDDFKFLLPQSRMSFLTFKEDENIIRSDKNGASFYSFWLCYKTKLVKTFNQLLDGGSERTIESYDEMGNVIEENHLNLFTLEKESNQYTNEVHLERKKENERTRKSD
jgi:hypothetical protein